MNLNEYQSLALRTAPVATADHDLTHALLGFVSEVGELADAIKKRHASAKLMVSAANAILENRPVAAAPSAAIQ